MVDQHVGLGCEHDDGRMVSARRQRAAWSEEPEVRGDVFALPAREPDHLDEVSIVDPRGIEALREQLELKRPALRVAGAQNRCHWRGSVAAGIDARILQQPGRVQQDLPRIGAAVDGAVDQKVVRFSVVGNGRPEDLGDGFVPLNRDVRVSLFEEIAPGRQPGELEGPELGRRRKEMVEGRVEPIDDADSVAAAILRIDHDRGHRVPAQAAIGARHGSVNRDLGVRVAGSVLVLPGGRHRHGGDCCLGSCWNDRQHDEQADRGSLQ